MTAKISASADGLKVYIGNAAEDALEINQTAKTIKGINGYLMEALSPGTIIDFGGASVPNGYLRCDGAAVSRTTYAALFAAIGTAWGVGNGSTTFNVPNFATGDSAVQGTVGGSTDGQMPSHSHLTYPAGWQNAASGSGAWTGNGSQSATNSAGSGTRNLAAGKFVNKLIKT